MEKEPPGPAGTCRHSSNPVEAAGSDSLSGGVTRHVPGRASPWAAQATRRGWSDSSSSTSARPRPVTDSWN